MKRFLASEIPDAPPEECRFHIIPAPLEATVSYGGGTARGPDAILEASFYLEAYDGSGTPCDAGIATLAAVQGLEEIEAAVSKAWNAGATPVLLGGEHTVTLGALRALKKAGREFGVVQFDAHADLRDVYEGDPLSHACVMRRAVDDLGLPLFQVGVRALSEAEDRFRGERDIPFVDAADLAADGTDSLTLPPEFPGEVYLTIDVDVLDPSIMPSTGTPEPGGLGWYTLLSLIESCLRGRRTLGFDVVEFAPLPALRAPDTTAATLVYRVMAMLEREGG
jgi:agmatinase